MPSSLQFFLSSNHIRYILSEDRILISFRILKQIHPDIFIQTKMSLYIPLFSINNFLRS